MKLTPIQMLDAMLVLCTQRFAGKFDKNGQPYILHCLAVMYGLDTDDYELMCIGLGHDLVEDTKTSYEELKNIGMSDRVILGIRGMTRVPGETEEEYQTRVLSNPDTIKTKKSDIRHNTDVRRMKGTSEKDMARTAKYFRFYARLEAAS